MTSRPHRESSEETASVSDATLLRPGRYRHYKGNLYEVIETARHSETKELMVVYRCLYGDHSLWVRPLAMFTEEVLLDGRSVPRFERTEEP
jgi:hypothetical protein